MPTDISNYRYARSFLTASGDEIVTAELDFQLGVRQGIAINQVVGWVRAVDFSAIGTSLETNSHSQSLHLETGTVELPSAPGVDEFVLDTEIFYIQTTILGGITTGAAGAGFALSIDPNAPVVYDPPLFTTRNITHRVESEIAGADLECGVMIRYKYVEFSLAEMGVLLARRL